MSSGLPETERDIAARWTLAQSLYRERNDLVLLSREMYRMTRDRKSTFLGDNSSKWRASVAPEYWYGSSRPQNSIDIAVAILSGYPPQYRVSIPGKQTGAVMSRAEKFLSGVWRSNSRRQNADLYRRVTMRMVTDGAVGVRVLWDVNAPEAVVETLDPPPDEGATDKWVVARYPRNLIPIRLDVVPWDQLYPLGQPTFLSPYSELLHVQRRTFASVISEWQNIEGAEPPALHGTGAKRMPAPHEDKEATYIEWWGYDDDGDVRYMVVFNNKVVVPQHKIAYPCIPYVIGTFKEGDQNDPTYGHLPFIFPILWLTEKEEYMRSRTFRIIDMLANMMPVHRGGNPVTLSGSWGEVINLSEDRERIEFPEWPGNPPDVWKIIEDIMAGQSQGTFSDAMFGAISSRISGYGLSQLIGADTLRTDTPRSNLEMLYAGVGDDVFQLLQAFSSGYHINVTTSSTGRSLSAMLAGYETDEMVVDAFLKPRQASDEQRLATIGAQLASLPKPPVSIQYILEHYFGESQPEEEMARVLNEEAMRDPVVRMIALVQVLEESGSPYAGIMAAKLGEVMLQHFGGGPQGSQGMGMGLQQATAGNPPLPTAFGQVGGGESLQTQQAPATQRMGGPLGEE